MNKERIDDLVNIISEKYGDIENMFVVQNNEQLLKYINNPNDWKGLQLAYARKYRDKIKKMGAKVNEEMRDMTTKVVMLGYREVAPNSIKVTQSEITGEIPKSLADKIKSLQKATAEEIARLCNVTLKQHSQSVRVISGISKTDELYDAIKKYTVQGLTDAPSVRYVDGKNYTFRSYMEMHVRTELQTEISNQQIEAGTDVGQVFYFCDTYGDCAPDHADYQGKYYYNDAVNIPKNVQEYIDSNGIMSMQEVRDSDPWLTTRPNCRHAFHAVPLDEVMGGTFDKTEFTRGNYKDSNYAHSQEMRKTERTIRKFKTQELNATRLYDKTNDERYKLKADAARVKVNSWNNEAKTLSKEYNIPRDKSRESIAVMKTDIGVKYDIKVRA